MVLSKTDSIDWFIQCLKSIKKQSVKLERLVCVLNDVSFSTDMKKLISSSAFEVVTPTTKSFMNLGPALNVGLEFVESSLICRFDPDDVYFKDRIKKQMLYLNQNPGVDVLGTSLVEFFDKNSNFYFHQYPTQMRDISRELPKNNPVAHPSALLKTKSITQVNGYRDIKGVEDYDLWIRILRAGGIINNLDEPLVFYRTNPNNLKRASIKLIISDSKIYKELISLNYSIIYLSLRLLFRFIYRLLPNEIKSTLRKYQYLDTSNEYRSIFMNIIN